MHPHLIAAVVAAAVGALAGAAATKIMPTQKPNTILVNAGPNATTKSAMRLSVTSWGELKQEEVDALTAALKSISPKTPVVIFCMEEPKCGDMALDFENAFESAKWPVDQERPLADATVGIGTNSQEMAALIDRATNGRIKPVIIQANLKDKIALVIGKKPKQ